MARWAFYTSTVHQIPYTKDILPFPKHSSSRHGGCFQTGSQAVAAKQPGELPTENNSAFQLNKLFPSKLFLSLGQCLESHGHVILLSQLKIQSCLGVGIMEIIEVINN